MILSRNILTDKQIDRQSNLEVLRILSMILIVLSHSIVHGNLGNSDLIYNEFSIIGLQLGSRIGVNCFILISGYFMVESTYKVKKLYSLLFQIFTYSIAISSILIIIGVIPFSIKNMIYAILPTITSQYWFATAYVILYLFTPYLQLLVMAMTKKQHGMIISILLFIWSIIPTILLGNPGYSNLGWLICIWLIAAYIRLYHNHSLNYIKVWHGILCLLIIVLMTIGIYYIGSNDIFIQENAVYLFAEMNKVPAVICSLLLFLGFKNIHIKNSNWINNLAGCTFGVYLLHDNPQIRSFLWEQICQNQNYVDSPWFVIHLIVCVIIVFICGIVVEMLRKKLINSIKRSIIYGKSKYYSSNL